MRGFGGRKYRGRGEDHLSDLEAVSVNLENGEVVAFKMDKELSIPTDPAKIQDEAERAPARTAFWSYQTERCLYKLKTAERELEVLEGEKYIAVRDHLMTHPDWRIPKPTEAMIRSVLTQQEAVGDLREKIAALRESFGILRGIKEACEHRCFLLRKLIAQDQQARFGQ